MRPNIFELIADYQWASGEENGEDMARNLVLALRKVIKFYVEGTISPSNEDIAKEVQHLLDEEDNNV